MGVGFCSFQTSRGLRGGEGVVQSSVSQQTIFTLGPGLTGLKEAWPQKDSRLFFPKGWGVGVITPYPRGS